MLYLAADAVGPPVVPDVNPLPAHRVFRRVARPNYRRLERSPLRLALPHLCTRNTIGVRNCVTLHSSEPQTVFTSIYLISFHPCYRQESKRHQILAYITNANIEIKQYCKVRTDFFCSSNKQIPTACSYPPCWNKKCDKSKKRPADM